MYRWSAIRIVCRGTSPGSAILGGAILTMASSHGYAGRKRSVLLLQCVHLIRKLQDNVEHHGSGVGTSGKFNIDCEASLRHSSRTLRSKINIQNRNSGELW